MLRGRKKRRAEALARAAQAESEGTVQAESEGTIQATSDAAMTGKPPKTGKRPKASKPPKPKKQPKPQRRPSPKGPARQTRLTRLVGLAFCIAGFAAIALGWSGAAGKDCTECQMPYLLSGGAAGIGLIVFGVGMMLMAQLRTEGRRLADRLENWRSSGPMPGGAPAAPNGSAASVGGSETPVSDVDAGQPASGPPTPPAPPGEGPRVATPAGPG